MVGTVRVVPRLCPLCTALVIAHSQREWAGVIGRVLRTCLQGNSTHIGSDSALSDLVPQCAVEANGSAVVSGGAARTAADGVARIVQRGTGWCGSEHGQCVPPGIAEPWGGTVTQSGAVHCTTRAHAASHSMTAGAFACCWRLWAVTDSGLPFAYVFGPSGANGNNREKRENCLTEKTGGGGGSLSISKVT